ncbi:hypothetical protein [Amycolatopsis regifaucium]|uniref:Uncharacterized protein n=1 Tax=Amycolatopsis regifaucium TaxID=546365 RepID=A0A154MJM7_9PSEU|nr:hypothetical protein [Amycolatopsis regifaucium]KZB84561.1 hypothetical protein AVL48_32785 [Amycolatopsis regifaucium]OKA11025.1 hypothetical protein ATP06_0202450 [Amycolatopsis regifaucium]SFI25823.1 hypothetical protein SAMN04489731_109236 [Amycolatopsis regifaucium]
MRGIVAATVVLAAFIGGTAPALAQEVPAPQPVCKNSDSRLSELSGLVSDGEHLYALNDGGTKTQVFVLGRDCKVQKVISAATDPYDPEDLARTADGTFWLSDTGDNRKKRDTVALISLTPQGKATLHRLTYPDGQHDVEALIMDRSGTPYLITKDVFGDAKVYRPTGPLASPGPTPLESVGSLQIKETSTPGGPVGSIGSMTVTGAASMADGSVVALRTYTDAYLYAVTDGDLAGALQREPVRVPLPNEKQGEALAFDPDGTLLSGGEGVGEQIRAVKGAAALATAKAEGSTSGGTSAAGGKGQGTDFPYVQVGIAAVVVIGGLLLVGRLRKRRT